MMNPLPSPLPIHHINHHQTILKNISLQSTSNQQPKKITKEKRAEKRDNAKKRAAENKKQGFNLDEIPEKYIPEGYENADSKTRKKMEQQMKNRLSAQKSRDNKKSYVDDLEKKVDQLSALNKKSELRIKELEAELSKLRETRSYGSQNFSTGTSLSSEREPLSDDLESPPRRFTTRMSNGFSNFAYMAVFGIVCLMICFMGSGDNNFIIGQNGRQVRNLMAQHALPGKSGVDMPSFQEIYAQEIFKYIFEPLRSDFLDSHQSIHNHIETKNLFRDPKENLTKSYQYGAPKITLSNSFDQESISHDVENSVNVPVLIDEKAGYVRVEELVNPQKTTIICPGLYEVSDNTHNNEPGALDKFSNLPNTEYLQILIPKSGHNLLSQDGVRTNSSPDDEGKYWEFYAKVYYMREIEIDKQR